MKENTITLIFAILYPTILALAIYIIHKHELKEGEGK